VKLGSLSYTVYLLHNGINMLLHFGNPRSRTGCPRLDVLVVTCFAGDCNPCGGFIVAYFEKPFIRWRIFSFGYEQVAETRRPSSISVGVATPVTES